MIEVGAFRPAQLPDGRPYDPVVAGCSIGRENGVDAGTLGGWAYDLDRDRIVLLTNNHVLTPRGARRRPPTDSGVVQPGWLMFTGVPRRIGSTARVVEMATHPSDPYGPPFTPVDAAIATIDVPFDYRIAELDVPAIFETQVVGPMDITPVPKRGMATGLTRGTIVTPFMDDIEVDFGAPGPPEWARFPRGNVFRVDGGQRPFASAGDSGSLVLAQTPARVRTSLPVLGLIFARDPVGNVASVCRIGPVMHHLNLATLCEGAARTLVRAAGIRQ